METRRGMLDRQVEKAYQLERPMAFRVGPRQDEFALLPKSVRFNLFLFERGHRKAFQIDGRQAVYVKEEFRYFKRSLLLFLSKHCRVRDLVCIDYPYGILVTSERALGEHIPGFSARTLPREIMAHAGSLLEIPCTIVGRETRWDGNPHQIAITVDHEELKQYMCTHDEFLSTFALAQDEYQRFLAHADEYNALFTQDPIECVHLELRGKTRTGVARFEENARASHETHDIEEDDLRVYYARDVARLASVD